MQDKKIETYYPKTKQQWRKWLLKNHSKENAVWVVFYKKKSNIPSISWSDAVDEALCFGWIDSVKKKLDEERSIQFFSKRKPKSTWSKINKEKVKNLIETGKMTQSGLDCIDVAKQNGSWQILDSVEELVIPEDLEKALKLKAQALDFFLSLNKSTKKMLLQWLVLAKREDTRKKRISEIVESVLIKQKPK